MRAVVVVVALLSLEAPAAATPALRTRMTVDGDVRIVGSTLAHDCGSAPTPPGAAALCTGVLDGDSGADAYWRDGSAGATVSATSARTSAELVLPPGATVKYARLYWSATLDASTPDLNAVLDRPGGFSAPITADASSTALTTGPLPLVTYIAYQASADVTALVASHGSGIYRVSDVAGIGLDGVLSEIAYAGWSLAVIYEQPGSPPRTVALHDGLDAVTRGSPVSLTAAGFGAPASGSQARLAVWALSARSAVGGDSLRVNGTMVSAGENPPGNFFNRSHTVLGMPAAGQVPAFPGTAGSLSGYDLDLVDVGAMIRAGDSSVSVTVSTGDDSFWLGGVVLSVLAAAPPDAGTPPPPPPPPPPADAAVAPPPPPPPPPPDAPRPPADAAGTRPEAASAPAPDAATGDPAAPPPDATISDGAAGELPPHVPEEVLGDAGPSGDGRAAALASTTDGPNPRATGFVAEGSGCACLIGAAPTTRSYFVPSVIAIGLAAVIRRRRPANQGPLTPTVEVAPHDEQH